MEERRHLGVGEPSGHRACTARPVPFLLVRAELGGNPGEGERRPEVVDGDVGELAALRRPGSRQQADDPVVRIGLGEQLGRPGVRLQGTLDVTGFGQRPPQVVVHHAQPVRFQLGRGRVGQGVTQGGHRGRRVPGPQQELRPFVQRFDQFGRLVADQLTGPVDRTQCLGQPVQLLQGLAERDVHVRERAALDLGNRRQRRYRLSTQLFGLVGAVAAECGAGVVVQSDGCLRRVAGWRVARSSVPRTNVGSGRPCERLCHGSPPGTLPL